MYKLYTHYPHCEGLDNTKPIGAGNDNTTSSDYIGALEDFFKTQIPPGDPLVFDYLELGCAGGQIVLDLVNRGHNAYGIEGTPHPRNGGRSAWVEPVSRNRMFEADVSKPFLLQDSQGTPAKFDIISHWEFAEHLPTKSLHYFTAKLFLHLRKTGRIFSGISPWGNSTNVDKYFRDHPEHGYSPEIMNKMRSHEQGVRNQPDYHLSCFFFEEWRDMFFGEFFDVSEYTLAGKLRTDGHVERGDQSIYMELTRRSDKTDEDALKVIHQYTEENNYTIPLLGGDADA